MLPMDFKGLYESVSLFLSGLEWVSDPCREKINVQNQSDEQMEALRATVSW